MARTESTARSLPQQIIPKKLSTKTLNRRVKNIPSKTIKLPQIKVVKEKNNDRVVRRMNVRSVLYCFSAKRKLQV